MSSDNITAADIGIGYGVWEKAPAMSDYDPRGGTVVDIAKSTDNETGEVHLSWTTISFRGGEMKFLTLTDDQVSATHAHGPNNAFLRRLIRRICSTVGTGSKKSWTEWDRRAVRAAYVLSGVAG